MNKELLLELVQKNLTLNEIAKKLGRSTTNVRYWLLKHNIPRKPAYKTKHKWTKEIVSSAVSEVTTYTDLCKSLGISNSGGSYQRLRAKMQEWGISTDHFISNPTVNPKFKIKIPWQDVLVYDRANTGQRTKSSMLKRAMLEAGFNNTVCAIAGCQQTNIWNGQELVLQIDHINGDRLDDRPENLRFICPNCHTQTKTFSSRNIIKNKCVDCGSKVSNNKTKRCINCSNVHESSGKRARVDWPSIEELKAILSANNFSEVGRLLGCSDNAVRKHLRKHGVDPKTVR